MYLSNYNDVNLGFNPISIDDWMFIIGVNSGTEANAHVTAKLRTVRFLLTTAPSDIPNTQEDRYESVWDYASSKGYNNVGLLLYTPVNMADWYATVAGMFALDYQITGRNDSRNRSIAYYDMAVNLGFQPMPVCQITTDCTKDPSVRKWADEFSKQVQNSFTYEVKPYLDDEWLIAVGNNLIEGIREYLSVYIKFTGSQKRLTDFFKNIPYLVGGGLAVGALAYILIPLIVKDILVD